MVDENGEKELRINLTRRSEDAFQSTLLLVEDSSEKTIQLVTNHK